MSSSGIFPYKSNSDCPHSPQVEWTSFIRLHLPTIRWPMFLPESTEFPIFTYYDSKILLYPSVAGISKND